MKQGDPEEPTGDFSSFKKGSKGSRVRQKRGGERHHAEGSCGRGEVLAVTCLHDIVNDRSRVAAPERSKSEVEKGELHDHRQREAESSGHGRAR